MSEKCSWINHDKNYYLMPCCDGLHFKGVYPVDNLCPVCGKEIEVKGEGE
jgi:hypothetical protein